MKQYRRCWGCKALTEHDREWRFGCGLEYQIVMSGPRKLDPSPGEPCPKPTTMHRWFEAKPKVAREITSG